MIHDLLDGTKLREVSVFTSRNIRRRLSEMEATPSDGSSRTLLVGRVWEKIPERERLIRDIAGLLARSALAAWPRWYDNENALLEGMPGVSEEADEGSAVKQRGTRTRNVLPAWLDWASQRCVANRLPLTKRYPVELQLRQLALAMSWKRFVLILAINATTLSSGEAKCFADVCSWIARIAEIRIAVVLDEKLLSCPGLETISYHAMSLSPPLTSSKANEAAVADHTKEVPARTPTRTPSASADTKIGRPKRQILRRTKSSRFAWPVVGMPHPFSPGEQRLAAQLEKEEDLRGLFRLNWPITASSGSRYVVDLVCESVRLIVEVDGYSTHCSRKSFQADRSRDFALAIDGFTVVRLTHAEVMRDTVASVSKIRTVLESLRTRLAGNNL